MVFHDDREANAADVSDMAGASLRVPTWDPQVTLAFQSQAVQNVEHGIVLVNDMFGSTKVNPAAARILGIPAGFCLTRDFIASLEALRLRCANAPSLATTLTQLLASSEGRISKWLWHVEEPAAYFHLSVAPLRTNTLMGHVWVFQDVSNLFDALHSVHSLEHRLHQLLSEGDVIAFRLRRGGVFDWVSGSTMRMLGFEDSAYLGRNASEVCHPDDVPPFIEKVKTLRETTEPQNVSFRINDSSGRVRSLEGRIFLAHDDHESIEVIMSDVTSHVELQLLRAQVTSAASHEFKTPLAFMSTALTMMEDGTLDPASGQGREVIDRMLSASGRLARMSDTLLTLQHLEITRSLVTGPSVNPGRVVERAALTIPMERSVTVDLRDLSGDARVHIDTDLFEQAIINLVDNAVRHSPTGGVVEVVTRVDGRTITISVRDHGPGVPLEFRDNIFEPFVRLDRDRAGVGLGLAIVHRIARLHSGSIVVDVPDDGIGSIFTLTLTDTGGGEKMTSLLLVEDDPDMQFALRLGLEEGGFHVSVAEDGQSALDVFHAKQPELVILDVMLGRESFDGFETCRRLRKVSSVPVIFLTVRNEDVDQLLGLAIGADDYLIKPVSPRVLCARVNMALEHCSRTGLSRTVFALGDLIVDAESRQVHVRDVPVDLTRIEFDILAALAESPKRVVTRDQLTSQVWGNWFGSDAHLDVHMSRLRKKILDAGGPRIGHSVRGVGFKLH